MFSSQLVHVHPVTFQGFTSRLRVWSSPTHVETIPRTNPKVLHHPMHGSVAHASIQISEMYSDLVYRSNPAVTSLNRSMGVPVDWHRASTAIFGGAGTGNAPYGLTVTASVRPAAFTQGKLFLGGLDSSTTKESLLKYCLKWCDGFWHEAFESLRRFWM